MILANEFEELLIRIDERVEKLTEDNEVIFKKFEEIGWRLDALEGYKNKALGFICLAPIILPVLVMMVI